MMNCVPNGLRCKDKTGLCHDGKYCDDKDEYPMLYNLFHVLCDRSAKVDLTKERNPSPGVNVRLILKFTH